MDILDTHNFDRRQRRNMSWALFLSLSPFFLSAGLYIYLLSPAAPTSVTTAVLKSAPVLLLAAAVLSWNGGQGVPGVVGGLLLSAVGDCCLVWPELFLHGMGAFAAAHLLYSLSFLSSRYATYSSSSWTRPLYLILLLTGVGFYIYLFPFLRNAPDSEIMTPAVGVYALLITVMAALAVRTRRVFTLLGSLIFVVSDVTLALQVFKVTTPTPFDDLTVMATYYLAQLLIAVGDIKATENKDDFGKWKKT